VSALVVRNCVGQYFLLGVRRRDFPRWEALGWVVSRGLGREPDRLAALPELTLNAASLAHNTAQMLGQDEIPIR